MLTLNEKICTRCKQTKEEKEFSARSTRKSGKASWCKTCLNEWRQEYRAKNKEKYKHYEFVRGLKRFYGLTLEQYKKMLESQNNVCAACGSLGTDIERGFHVDHDKHTGQVRAILCGRCNPGLGFFDHDIKKLEQAIAYLKKFKK